MNYRGVNMKQQNVFYGRKQRLDKKIEKGWSHNLVIKFSE